MKKVTKHVELATPTEPFTVDEKDTLSAVSTALSKRAACKRQVERDSELVARLSAELDAAQRMLNLSEVDYARVCEDTRTALLHAINQG